MVHRVKNRKFVSLSKLDQKKLADNFCELRQWVSTGELEGFEQLSISVFDHWLSTEEAQTQLDGASESLQRSHNKKLHSFVSELASKAQPYLVKLKGRRRNNVTFRKFTSAAARDQFLVPAPYNCGDRWRFILVFPALDAAYFEGSDFTHHIFFRKRSKLKELEQVSRRAGVYAL